MPWKLIIPSLLGVALIVVVGGPLVREMVPGKIPEGDGSALAIEPGPYIHAHCPQPCRVGAHVNIMAGQTEAPTWAAVYAEANGKRIWYYPTEVGTLPEVPVRKTVRALSEDITLSKEHSQSRAWDLHLLLLKEPVARDAIDALPKERVLKHETLSLNIR